jgi:molybdopterin-guanine dinucleotide biosynthesis protein A
MSTRRPSGEFDALVLAGGSSTRLGADKTRLTIGGTSLLDRVLAAVPDADRVIVVGDERRTVRPVKWLREDPPGSGPAAAVVAGLAEVRADLVVVLAGDLAMVDAGTVGRLLDALGGPDDAAGDTYGPAGAPDGALLTDQDGRRQHLTGAHRTAALRRAAAARESWTNAAMHLLLAPLSISAVVPHGNEAHDVDTPADLAAAVKSARGHELPR